MRPKDVDDIIFPLSADQEPSLPVIKKRTDEKLSGLGLLLLVAISFFWGIAWPIMKIALQEIPPLTFRTIGVVFGGFGIILLARLNGLILRIPRRELRPLLVVSLLNVTGWHICSIYGIILMGAGRAAIVAYTMPVWAVIFSCFMLKERMTPGIIIGLILGMGGLALLVGPEVKSLGSAPLGALLMLAAAIFWAAGTVGIKYFRWSMSVALLTGWQLILGGIPIVVGAIILEPVTSILHLSMRGSLATIYIVLVPIIFCQWAWFKIIHLFPASLAAIGTLATPVIGVVSSALMLKEPCGFREITALIMIVAALAIVMTKPKEPYY
ncbi:MAG: DMT family transporter [Pseudomonadota bacterium]